MSRNILQDIIDDFNPVKFTQFFRQKNRNFAPRSEQLSIYDDGDFSEGQKLGEIHFDSGEEMIFCTFKSNRSLSERSGKKAQYEKAKKILKEKQADAGIFVFYDNNGNFRFSLVYANYLGKKRDWSSFKRFTYFVGKELTNKTFLLRVGDGDFSAFYKIKDAFSVEKVTKEFYESIANWYFWAVEHCRFPESAETEENGRNIAVIRLITRMIFVWFMRERGLMPKHLFEKEKIDKILVEMSAEDSTYYTAILQNLFFATLSTKKEERKFRSEIRGHKGYNPDFGNQYVYRYHNLFRKSDEIKNYFGEIPFLNGGLFECLDDGKNNRYIDGFTARKKFQPSIPNFLFFSQERKADLSKAYGTKKKIYKVRGLLDILSSYNFTIDENSPDDADVALDPELLGRVFENLLASFNPETSTTARKATGSYYTPREIVDYMVTESLKAYFKTHFEAVDEIDEKLEKLFSSEEQENPFDQKLSKKLVELIESVKIVDPAVGSGAFPMGALNKLVFILNKIDPGNELWKQAQIKAADSIPDPSARRMAKEKIEEFFQGKNADYGRKLFLIQRCIYGVDIQQIAVEIAKLRFFISLLVDEKIDKEKDNWGIEPLPNLDFKIMQGNSLIELLSPSLLAKNTDSERSQLIDELKARKDEFLSLSDPVGKKKCKERILELVRSIVNYDQDRKKEELEKNLGFFNENQKLFEMSGDNLSLDDASTKKQAKISAELKQLEKVRAISPKDHFEWHLHFNEVFENGGFDIVIANPPYIFTRDTDFSDDFKRYISENYFSLLATRDKGTKANQSGKINLFALFILGGLFYCKKGGVLNYIVPNNLLRTTTYDLVRKYILDHSKIEELVDLGSGVFGGVTAATIIFRINNGKNNLPHKVKILTKISDLEKGDYSMSSIDQDQFMNNISYTFNIYADKTTNELLNKILTGKNELGDFCVDIMEGIVAHKQLISLGNTKYNQPLLEGKSIRKFGLNKIKKFITWDVKKIHRTRPEYLWTAPKKIVIQRISGGSSPLTATLDIDQYKTFASVNNLLLRTEYEKYYEFILALINSKVLNWYYCNSFSNNSELTVNISKTFLEKLPIPELDNTNEENIKVIVGKILEITKSVDYLQNPVKQAKVKEYEKQIDQMVYKLYNLTPEEIEIIEKSSPQ